MVRGILLALMIVTAGCSSGSPAATSTVATATTVAAVVSEPTPTTAPAASAAINLADKPFIVFAPVGPQPPRMAGTGFPDGSADYFELFAEGSPWEDALAEVDSFKIHSWQAREYYSDDELRQLFAFLQRNDIPLMVEMEPLQPPDPSECSHGESFEGPHEIATAEKIKSLGGVIAAAAIEQPYTYGHKLDTRGACQYSLERIMDEVVSFNSELREIFPDIVIGSIEGVWVQPETTPNDMAIWLDTYNEAAGEYPAFLHMDLDWTNPNWEGVLLGIEQVARERGVPFGVIYNGNGEETNDDWLLETAVRMTAYEVTTGGSPDHVIFQSWVDQPDRVLPDDDPRAFTSLINRYFGIRPSLVDISFDSETQTVSGGLEGLSGEAIGGAAVEVMAVPVSGVPQTVVFEGVAPEFASQALIGIRVNAEGAGYGALDASLSSIEFNQDGLPSPVAWDFSAGSSGWGVADTAGKTTFAGGEMRLSAAAGEEILINGESFDVASGAEFTLTVDMAVVSSMDIVDSGMVVVMFLSGDVELLREGLDITGQPISLGSAETNALGRYSLVTQALQPGTYLFEAATNGGAFIWTAAATTTVVVE